MDGNKFINATKLREPIEFLGGKARPVAQEVTDANMRILKPRGVLRRPPARPQRAKEMKS